MKLATFSQGGSVRIGVVRDHGLVDLATALPDAPRDMLGLIADWERWRGVVVLATREREPDFGLGEVGLLAPVLRPRKVLGIGLNYADHIAESRFEAPTAQVWFCKQPTAINGPYSAIEIPKVSSAVDYEAEMVAVIGRGGRHISQADAPAAVFGYMVGNDVSVRDWQRETPQWMLGKSFDTHAPVGPWITTADEVGDPHVLDISCLVNGEVRQRSNTRHMVFNTFAQIEHLSKAMTLEPGDIIFTGTPRGVGAAMKPPRLLTRGDRVRVEIERLGYIEAEMVPEGAHAVA